MVDASQATSPPGQNWQRQNGHQGQAPIQNPEHGCQGNQGGNRGIHGRHDPAPCRHDQGLDIVGGMGHQVPGPITGIEGRRHAGKVLKQASPQNPAQAIGCP